MITKIRACAASKKDDLKMAAKTADSVALADKMWHTFAMFVVIPMLRFIQNIAVLWDFKGQAPDVGTQHAASYPRYAVDPANSERPNIAYATTH